MDFSTLRARLKPPGPVIDVHVHPLPVRGRDATLRESADFLIENADRAGITRMVLMNIGRTWKTNPTPDEFRRDNDECLEIRALAPDRFLPLCCVNPEYPDESLAELDRCIARSEMVGVKLWVAVRASDPRVKA